MHKKHNRGIAFILSTVLSVSILFGAIPSTVYAQDTVQSINNVVSEQMIEQAIESANARINAENQLEETQPIDEITPKIDLGQSQASELEEDVIVESNQTEAQEPAAEQIVDNIYNVVEYATDLAFMDESQVEDLIAFIAEIESDIAALPEGQTEVNQEDLEYLENAKAAAYTMQQALQAQKEGRLDELEQTGIENSWRYQNGQRVDMEQPATLSDLPDGVSAFASGKYWGIDVSHHQSTINWEQVRDAGIDFVIIRCGYGSDLTKQDDKQWERNVAECERLGIPYGVYLYSYATDESMAYSEAQHTLRLLKGHNPDLPVFFDMEDNIQAPVGNVMLGKIAKTYCDAIQAAGYEVGIYANYTWWIYYLTEPVFENDTWYRWVAQWGPSCSYKKRYEIWQYTDAGTIAGIAGKVDMDYWYGEWGNSYSKIEDGVYTISTVMNPNKVIEVTGGSLNNGSSVQLYSNNGTLAQQFEIISQGNGYYILENRHSGKVLEVTSGLKDAGTKIQQWDFNGTDAQLWSFEDAGNGTYYIRSKGSGLYLDVTGWSTADGASIQIYYANRNSSQKFILNRAPVVEVAQGIYTISTIMDSNKVLDIYGASMNNGASVQLYSDNGTLAQQFEIVSQGDGFYILKSRSSGKVLEVTSGLKTAGTKIQQWDFNGTDAQLWSFEDAGDGTYYIRSKGSGLYLDVTGWSTANGSSMQIYYANRSASQKFQLNKVSIAEVTRGFYTISTVLSSNKVIEISGGNMNNGASAQLYAANGTLAQQFEIIPQGNGYYILKNRNSGKVLEVTSGLKDAGTKVQQWDFNGTDAQLWCFQNAGDGTYYIQSKGSGLYLDVSGWNTDNGTSMQIYYMNKDGSQKFQLTKATDVAVEQGFYTISTVLDGNKVIEISGGNMNNGASAQLYAANGTLAQQFEIIPQGNGYYILKNRNSGKVLEVTSGLKDAGTKIQQWDFNGTDAQLWSFEDAGNGMYYICSKGSGLYLDVSGWNTSNGTSLQIYYPNRDSSQKFYVNKIK